MSTRGVCPTASPFPVALPSCVRRAARCGPPVLPSPRPVRVGYKREVGTSRTRRLPTGSEPRRPGAMGAPTPSLLRARSRRWTTTPAPPLAPTEARRPLVAAAVTPPRRNRGAPQSATAVAAARPRRRPHRSKLQSKSGLGTPLVLLRPRSAAPGHRFVGIWPDRRRPVPRDHIARSQVFRRASAQTGSISVRILKLPGTSVKVRS
jgi:hypothetical protein